MTHIGQANGRAFVLRLMRAIIAALVAVSMAIFPLSMATAAVPGGDPGTFGAGHHGASAAGLHDHDHGKADAALACGAGAMDVAAGGETCHPGAGSDNHGAAFCCGGLACHFFQVSASPAILAPAGKPLSLAASGEEQLASALPDRLDRPPRTV